GAEGEVPGGEAVVADLVERPALDPRREPTPFLLHDDRRQSPRPGLARLRIADPAQHLQEVGLQGEARPTLLTGDDPFLAVGHRPGPDAGEVGAGARFREG